MSKIVVENTWKVCDVGWLPGVVEQLSYPDSYFMYHHSERNVDPSPDPKAIAIFRVHKATGTIAERMEARRLAEETGPLAD